MRAFILVAIILFLFLGNLRGALIVAMTIPFSLLFASICLDLRKIPANLLSLGALDFGMVVDGAVVMVENIVRHLTHANPEKKSVKQQIFEAAHEVQPTFDRDGASFAPSLFSLPCALRAETPTPCAHGCADRVRRSHHTGSGGQDAAPLRHPPRL